MYLLLYLKLYLHAIYLKIFFESFRQATELDPTNAVFYANRSLAHLRQESFESALEDEILSAKNDPTLEKTLDEIHLDSNDIGMI